MKLRLLLALLGFLIVITANAGALSSFKFDTPEQEQDFRDMAEQLRCLVCQNESLAGSNAELAQDLRQEIYGMMQSGKGKDEIVEFMVARYGDFVLYNPPLKPSTYPLWFGPFVLLGIAAFFLFRALSRKKQAQEAALSDAERDRLNRLLDSDRVSQDHKE